MNNNDTRRIYPGDRFRNQNDEIMRYNGGDLINQKTGVIHPLKIDPRGATVADLRKAAERWGVEIK